MILELKDHPNPVLMTFPQNLPINYDQLDVNLMVQDREVQDQSKLRRGITLKNRQMTWVGKSNLEKRGQPQLLVGVVKEGKIDIYPCFEQFTMQQFIHKQVGTNKSLLTQNQAEQKLTNFEQQLLVAEEMGTSKSRRKMRAMQTNRVQEANISHAQQTQQLFESKKEELQDQVNGDTQDYKDQETLNRTQLLPHFNPSEKTNAMDIFDISSLISEEDLESIDVTQIFVAITKKPEKILQAISTLDELTQNIILAKVENFEELSITQKMLFLKYSVFLNAMIKFISKNRFIDKDVDSIANSVQIREVSIVKNILSKFYQGSQGTGQNLNYTKSSLLADKFICHIIVLNLVLSDCAFEGDKLASILKLNPNKFSNYCKECGCSCVLQKKKNGEQTIKVKLNLPIKFPQKSQFKYK